MLGLLNRLHNMSLTVLSVELGQASASGERSLFRREELDSGVALF